jgi:hypothetical protein
MPINNSKELFVRMLSDVRQRTEHMTKIYQELSGIAQDPNIKELWNRASSCRIRS